MIIKLILIATALIMVGCAVFPSNTSVSMTSEVGELDEASVKLQQDFKWNK